MSSNNTFNSLPVLDSNNWQAWSTKMKAYLMFSGQWYVVTTTEPSPISTAEGGVTNNQEIKDWRKDDQKALGAIQLRLSTATLAKVESKTTAKDTWDELKVLYGSPNASSIINEFRAAINTQIPTNSNPRAAIDSMAMHFKRIADSSAEIKIPDPLQVLILVSRLPDFYRTTIDTVAMDDVTELVKWEWQNIVDRVVGSYEGVGKNKRKENGGQANKLSAVKKKKGEPQFQQQQRQDGSSGANNNKGWKGKGRGKRAGKQVKARQQNTNNHDHSHTVSSARVPLTPSIPDPRKPFFTGTPKPFDGFFKGTTKALDLARRMEIQPSMEGTKKLERIVLNPSDSGLTNTTSANHQFTDAQLQDRTELYEDALRNDPGPSNPTPSTSSLISRIDWAEDIDMGYASDGGVSLGSISNIDEEVAMAAGLDDQSIYYSDDEDRM